MKSLIKYISQVKDLHSLNEYLNEKLVIFPSQVDEKLVVNKNFKSTDDKICVPKSTRITGEESYDMIIKTIKQYNGKDFDDKVDKIFDDIHCDTFEYCFYDTVNDDADYYKKGFGKIFPNGVRKYKPAEYVNLELKDDDCPDDWDEHNSLAKFETKNGNYVIVWTAIDTQQKTMYAFISK